jgi:hypothetical protein
MVLDIFRHLGGASPSKAVRGHMLAAHGDDARLLVARNGDRISNASDAPPWLVVWPELDRLRPHIWPFRLLEVSVLKPIPVQGHTGAYIRASSIRVVAELEPSTLLGEQGDRVARWLDRCLQLTEEELRSLAAGRHADADSVAETVRARAASNPARYRFRDVNNVASAVGNAEFIIASVLYKRIAALKIPDAFEVIDEDQFLLDPWANAMGAVRDQALVLGAPELMSDDERGVLVQSWIHESPAV